MNRYIVRFSEINSGGYFRLTRVDYERLEQAGWEVDRSGNNYRARHHDGLPEYATKVVRADNEDIAYEMAVGEWEAVTEHYRYASGCPCCGDPYEFDVVVDEDYTWEDEFEEAAREALEYGDVEDLHAVIGRVEHTE